MHLRNVFLGSAVIVFAAVVDGEAQASSIAMVGAPAKTSSVVIRPNAWGNSASVVVVPPPSASIAVLDAPDTKMQTLSPSVVALGAPVPSGVDGAKVAAVGLPRDPLGTAMMPMVIRGGIVGNSFPNGGGSYAPPTPAEVQRDQDRQPQVGNDGQPAADVSPGDVSSAPTSSGRVAPRVMARPSSSSHGDGGGHLSPE